MKRNFRYRFLPALVLLATYTVYGQPFFSDAGKNALLPANGQRLVIPEQYRAVIADPEQLKSFLWSLPAENNFLNNRSAAPVLSLPMPDGTMARFRVWESSIMEPELAAKFPEMRSFAGQGMDDPYATIRFDFNSYFGFNAQILSPVTGRIYITPYGMYDTRYYISYYSADNRRPTFFDCTAVREIDLAQRVTAGPCRGTQLYTYRLALACTGEYAVAVAGAVPSTPAVAAAMLTSVNRVSGVYEQEAAIRLVLVANNDLLIYLNGATDPYTNNNGTTMLGQNQANIDAVIGNANYDIGHVFSTGGGGIASLGVVCFTGFKARGVTGRSVPVGDNFDIDFVAHEMGHQFNAEHTFNSITSSCGGGNRNGPTAYEPGSATTIMGYAGICGTDNIQPHSDPFFHSISFDEIGSLAAGSAGACPLISATGNSLPVITAMNNNGVSIPVNTPFTLTASATDANGDAITYCWEEWDLGTSGAWNNGASNATSPLFKSRVPKTSGSRTFPDMAVILAGYPANPAATMGGLKGETLPGLARAMKFRLTVRDNRAGGGGVVTGGEGCQLGFTTTFQVNVAGTTAFAVTSPNGGETYPQGTLQTITWNTASTNAAPFNVANVRISLSTDGGLSYPIVLATSTANDGSEVITLPLITTTTARVMIEALGNIFFDISNANFSITEPAGFPDLTHSQFFTSTQIIPGGVIDEVIGIRNVGAQPTSGPIVFTVTNYAPVTGLSAAPLAVPSVTIGFTNFILSNANWTSSSNASALTFTSNPGFSINPGTTALLGIRISRAAGANGTVTHTATVEAGTGGGETPVVNNSISNTLLKN